MRTTPLLAVAFALPVLAVAGPAAAAPTRIEGTNYALEIEPGACKVNQECHATIKLVAGGNFHVNENYPYKFVGGDGVNWAKASFTKEGGDFKLAGSTAVLDVVFTPVTKGHITVRGTFRLSVCSSSNCQVEKQPVTFDVDVR